MKYRDEVDWEALIEEGMKVQNLHPKVPEASILIASVDQDRSVVVVLVPCSRHGTERIKDLIMGSAGMVRVLLATLGTR